MWGSNRPRATGAFTKFRLLMWKNFLQQWRRRVQTIVEVLLPVAAMSLVLILRYAIKPVMQNTDTIYPPLSATDISLSFTRRILEGMNISHLSIAYSPKSPVLETVLNKVMVKMMMGNSRVVTKLVSDQFPDTISLDFDVLRQPGILRDLVGKKVLAYDNKTSMINLYSSEDVTRRVIAAVEFDDKLSGATQLPANLEYSLRFPEIPRQYSFYSIGSMYWHTDMAFPRLLLPGPRFPFSWEGGNDPGYVNEMFIAVQHLVSSELIAEATGQNVDGFRVFIQRYPHPPFVQDTAMDVMEYLIPLFIMISFSYTAVNTVKAITIEKESQLKETMKIMGLPTWLHWTAWFCKQFIFFVVIAILIVILVKMHWFSTLGGFKDYALFTNTPWSVLLFFLLCYLACTIFFCFMLSGLFSKAGTAALFTGVIWFFTYLPAFMLMTDVKVSTALQVFLCLNMNSAMASGFHYMLTEESAGGLQWGQFWDETDLDSSRFAFGNAIIMLAVDSVLYMLVALYLEQVFPGPYAAAKPWNFLCQKSFWMPNRKIMAANPNIEPNDTDIVVENFTDDHTIGVKMTKLTKVYGINVAVNNLNLDIYDGHITVLLGHNGAGKSTTMAMLTGNVEITSGSVWLAGYDISKQTESARANLGFCPQHNVLFDELTVREHLEFFGRLKGFTGQQLKDDINTLITKLDLEEKRNYQSAGLSGGQKRRLCVGVALSGAPRVVLLDEPTSGMDPASRRSLWDLLQKEKAGRSIILTTHFMDEADILGDRVAIMSSGRLQCVGSPFFLKAHYGVGYTLVVVKNEGFQPELCTEVIRRHIPEIKIKEDRGTEVKYALTSSQAHLFETMLKDLETNIDAIKFQNYGLMPTTLEEVFMSVGADLTPVPSASDDVNTVTTDSEQQSKDKKKLWMQHVLAVWLKLFLVWSRSWLLLLMQVLVPLILICISLGVLQWAMSLENTPVARELSLTRGFVETETLLSFIGSSSSSPGALAKTAYEHMYKTSYVKSMKLTVVEKQTVSDYYLNRIAEPSAMGFLRKRILIGATFDDSSGTAWFSNFGFHDVAISLNTLHQALLKAFAPDHTLRVFNYPLDVSYADQINSLTYMDNLSMQLSAGIGSSLSVASAVFIMFYIKERIIRAKLLQKAAGIQPIVMWGSAALFDWAWFVIICMTIVISFLAFQVVGFRTASEVGRMYLTLMVYGAAMLPLNYLMSLLFNGPVTGFVAMFFANIILGEMTAHIVQALLSPKTNTENVANFIDRTLQFFPLYSLVRSFTYLNEIGLTKWTCMRKCAHLSAVLSIRKCTMHIMCMSNVTMCCVRENPYFEWKKPGILRYLMCSLASGTVFWVVLMFVEYNWHRKIFTRTKKPPPLDKSSMDADVVDEMAHVEQIGKANLSQNSLVAKELSKYYKKHLAVNQISFTVADAEIFGLLGVNGAGKTTTFKMLMGDHTISSGDAFISGHSVKTDITAVYRHIGYCPQFDAVFGELTGRETLRLFSMVRGLATLKSTMRADVVADSLGLTKHLDKRINQYSGGNQRKLSTAVALLGSPRLVFVDEPTTGVDPSAKRRVWRAFLSARRSGCSVVLTSHSMEECEALCSRLTIMVNGAFQCLGTPQHLKNKFSEGFTLTIKMKIDGESTDSIAGTRGIAAVKRYVETNFNDPKLMEEYQGLLTYYLPDVAVPWSRMFGIMERCRETHDLEDYTISQTTLEQIFLQFTKYQKERQ